MLSALLFCLHGNLFYTFFFHILCVKKAFQYAHWKTFLIWITSYIQFSYPQCDKYILCPWLLCKLTHIYRLSPFYSLVPSANHQVSLIQNPGSPLTFRFRLKYGHWLLLLSPHQNKSIITFGWAVYPSSQVLFSECVGNHFRPQK